MLPEIKGKKIVFEDWDAFPYEEVLLYYDGPLLMLQRNGEGQLFLTWWNDTDEVTERWVSLPLSEKRLREILSGKIPSLDALQSPEGGHILVVDIDLESESVVQVLATGSSHVPQNSLPMTRSHAEHRLHLATFMQRHNGGSPPAIDVCRSKAASRLPNIPLFATLAPVAGPVSEVGLKF